MRDDRMRTIARHGTALAALTIAANTLHGVTHVGQDVALADWQSTFVATVVFLAPALAAVLLWTPLRSAGLWLLLASRVGAAVFGVVFHFLVAGPDNALTLESGAWRLPFLASAAFVLLVDIVAAFLALRMLKSLNNDPQSPTAHRVRA
jgi:hypothetical protein